MSLFSPTCFAIAAPSIIIAPDSTVLFWNAAAERLFGWSAEEAIGLPLPFVPPDKMEEHLQLRRRTLSGKGYSQQRVTRRDKEGRPIELTSAHGPSGVLTGASPRSSESTPISAQKRCAFSVPWRKNNWRKWSGFMLPRPSASVSSIPIYASSA